MFRFRPYFLWLVYLIAFVASASASDLAARFPNDWFTRLPTPERLKAVQAAGEAEGWMPVAARLFMGSISAYELRQEDAASAWYHVARWCDLFHQSQNALGRHFLEELNQGRGIHRNIDQRAVFDLPDEPVVGLLTDETIGWLLADREFAEGFFSQITPYDCVPNVLRILQTLRSADVRVFGEYEQLACAIALVYDEPPPPDWPHWQVSEKVLPRKLPDPLLAFKFLVDADQRRVTLQKLGTLSAGELKFTVDLAAPFSELTWAQNKVKFPLGELVKSYESVRYRPDRIRADQYTWLDETYSLADILRTGGICVDQAYFATQAGKARGVPTLLFGGAGQDGRHAWFGYLGSNRQWVLDAGRYEEQKYVTGVAFDPQSWLPLSDHEVSFLSEGFRRLSPYRQSWQQQVFAELYLRLSNKAAAATAARKAVNYERRNIEAWELLLKASAGQPALVREGLMVEAAQAMQRYPDLNARFVLQRVASLRARGEVSSAELEERTLARRGRVGGRTDMGVDQAVAIMDKAASGDLLRVYRQVLQQYGRGAGMDFYDRVTHPLVARMFKEKQNKDALQVIALTRAALKPEPDSQFDREMKALAESAKLGK